MRTSGPCWRWWWLALPGLMAVGAGPTDPPPPSEAARDAAAVAQVHEPTFVTLRRLGAMWETRLGPERVVVDQVCLVSDLPGFLRALAAWDREHWFPILFDEVETATRFIRAFRPTRIVRIPPTSNPAPVTWDDATAAVGKAWRAVEPDSTRHDGGRPPVGLGPTPPGLVLSTPEAPSLAGAVTLAAGRFQPLGRLVSRHHYGDILRPDQGQAFCQQVEAEVAARWPGFSVLGDDCDFLTLAGDWPYRVRDDDGQINALDDRVGRVDSLGGRWAYAGRLLGDPAQSVARAMSSLFLQPASAFLFNGYSESDPPWSFYATRLAATRFTAVVPTSQVSGPEKATVHGWHAAFDPANPHGLLWVNSHGSPTVFHLAGNQPASPADVPRGTPAAVALIHSFSAADPADPDTVAGRWLANGAFVFYGSVNEPFLDAFRPPLLIGDLLSEKLPMVAAVRRTRAEPRGTPWRLIYLGDPLYRVHARVGGDHRSRAWGETASWTRVEPIPPSAADPSPTARLAHAWDAALVQLQAEPPTSLPDLVTTLEAIPRDQLPTADHRHRFDALVGEVWLAAGRRAELLDRLEKIPTSDRTPALRRLRETCQAAELDTAITAGDDARVHALWRQVVDSDAVADFPVHATARAGRAADTPERRRTWAQALRDRLGRAPTLPPATNRAVCDELDRVEAVIRADPGPG